MFKKKPIKVFLRTINPCKFLLCTYLPFELINLSARCEISMFRMEETWSFELKFYVQFIFSCWFIIHKYHKKGLKYENGDIISRVLYFQPRVLSARQLTLYPIPELGVLSEARGEFIVHLLRYKWYSQLNRFMMCRFISILSFNRRK